MSQLDLFAPALFLASYLIMSGITKAYHLRSIILRPVSIHTFQQDWGILGQFFQDCNFLHKLVDESEKGKAQQILRVAACRTARRMEVSVYGQGKDGKGKDGKGKDGKDGYGKDGHGKDSYGKDGYGKDGYGKDGYGKGQERWDIFAIWHCSSHSVVLWRKTWNRFLIVSSYDLRKLNWP